MSVQTRVSSKMFWLKIGIALASMVGAIALSQWVAEKYFFDKFYYYKSIEHGYRMPGKKLSLEDFGERSADVLDLVYPERIKKIDTPGGEHIFTVAVFGDSHIWGQGLRNKDRMVTLLEKKLDRIAPSKVLSLAKPGDSILDHYAKYQMLLKQNRKVDFCVFAIVNNDLLLKKEDLYDPSIAAEMKSKCTGPFSYAPGIEERQIQGKKYDSIVMESFKPEGGSYCLLQTISKLLPRERSLFICFTPLRQDKWMDEYMSVLKNSGLKAVYPSAYPEILKKYQPLGQTDLRVSKKDGHPSAKVNEMIAEIVFAEIRDRGYLPK